MSTRLHSLHAANARILRAPIVPPAAANNRTLAQYDKLEEPKISLSTTRNPLKRLLIWYRYNKVKYKIQDTGTTHDVFR
jgi:hypothetical protein